MPAREGAGPGPGPSISSGAGKRLRPAAGVTSRWRPIKPPEETGTARARPLVTTDASSTPSASGATPTAPDDSGGVDFTTPPAFRPAANEWLPGGLGRCALVYMDDCLVHSPTLEQNLLNVAEVLEISKATPGPRHLQVGEDNNG